MDAIYRTFIRVYLFRFGNSLINAPTKAERLQEQCFCGSQLMKKLGLWWITPRFCSRLRKSFSGKNLPIDDTIAGHRACGEEFLVSARFGDITERRRLPARVELILLSSVCPHVFQFFLNLTKRPIITKRLNGFRRDLRLTTVGVQNKRIHRAHLSQRVVPEHSKSLV